MEIIMYNVGFGDFFVLKDKSEYCIVDCGSVRKSSIGNIARNVMSSFSSHSYIKGLVTHFHDDHFNGYKELAKTNASCFDELIIPFITIDQLTGKMILIELAIYFYIFLNSNTHSWSVSNNILTCLGTLIKLSKGRNIRCVSQGDRFCIGSQIFEVLWPKRVIEFDENIKKYLDELDARSTDIVGLKSLKESITQNFMEWRKKSENSEINQTELDNICNEQVSLLDELDKLHKKYLTKPSSNIISDPLRYHGTYLFSRSINSTSIVFHDSLNNNKKYGKLLMTGDVEKKL
jgi:ribonuclease BN (tRNA processing enzyme)